jgi:hypothetical protein
LGVVLAPCQEDVIDHSCPFLIPRWLQSDEREWFRAKTDTKRRRHAMLFPAFS